jgi:hypothetical protein
VAWLDPFVGNAVDWAALPVHPLHRLAPHCTFQSPHGRILPNIDDWRPGDILAYRSSSALPAPAEAAIIAYQTAVFGFVEPRLWTHVAIYDGNGLIWDAMPNVGVRQNTVAHALRTAGDTVSLRRWVNAPPISAHALATFLMQQLHLVYSLSTRQTMALLAQRLAGSSASKVPITERDVFCSSLVTRVFNAVVPGFSFPHRIALPGDFLHLADYDEVDLYWCRN